jgi:uncharacterized membrane protein YkoI
MKTITVLSIAVAICVTASTSSIFAAKKETQAQLQAEAKVTQAAAQKTALAKVANGKIKSSELEREHGKLVWSFDISTPGSKNITEVQVDAKTGKIVAVEVETPKDQAKEKAADKKEKK